MLYPSPSLPKRKRSDFYFLQSIGEGSYSKVYRVSEKVTNQTYALKQVSKSLLIRENKERYAFREKQALGLLAECPHFVHLHFTFQDADSLYYGLSYQSGGDLLDLIMDQRSLKMPSLVFYAAELVNAMLFMHSKHVIHRDLKPENVLLNESRHIKITDFGSCRILTEEEHDLAMSSIGGDQGSAETREEVANVITTTRGNESNLLEQSVDDEMAVEQPVSDGDPTEDVKPCVMKLRPCRVHSMVGTAQFVAPEVLQGKTIGYGCDFWSLGCIIFQMADGHHLFKGDYEYDILRKVCQVDYELKPSLESRVQNIVKDLVKLDPMRRCGVTDEGQLRNHPLFKTIIWSNIHLIDPPDPKLDYEV